MGLLLIYFFGITVVVLTFVLIVSAFRKYFYIYKNNSEKKNPFEGKKVIFKFDRNDIKNADGVKGHLESIGFDEYKNEFYEKYIKRMLDIIFAFWGLIFLSPVFIIIIIAIKLEDRGPIFFAQKRIGYKKRYFKLHKFRSMKVNTPKEVPTHMLENPDKYLTTVGKYIRSHSLDELPQIWDILVGEMSFVGPRPCLWNQELLIAERDKYCANIKPGLTGLAQISGRDELSIYEKAKLDGEYVINKSFLFDLKCFFKTFNKIIYDKSIVEGEKKNNEKDMK